MVNSSKKKRTNDTSVLEKDSGKTCRYCVLIFVAIILVQVLCIVILGAHKHGYHTDEVYSYLLSNSYDTRKESSSDMTRHTITIHRMRILRCFILRFILFVPFSRIAFPSGLASD